MSAFAERLNEQWAAEHARIGLQQVPEGWSSASVGVQSADAQARKSVEALQEQGITFDETLTAFLTQLAFVAGKKGVSGRCLMEKLDAAFSPCGIRFMSGDEDWWPETRIGRTAELAAESIVAMQRKGFNFAEILKAIVARLASLAASNRAGAGNLVEAVKGAFASGASYHGRDLEDRLMPALGSLSDRQSKPVKIVVDEFVRRGSVRPHERAQAEETLRAAAEVRDLHRELTLRLSTERLNRNRGTNRSAHRARRQKRAA